MNRFEETSPGVFTEVGNKAWPAEFLGRCVSCLDNAYLHLDCDHGLESECAVRRYRKAHPELMRAAREGETG